MSIDPVESKRVWLAALAEADVFVRSRPGEELGCLYYSPALARFVVLAPGVDLASQGMAQHYGSPGGVLPQPSERGL